MSSPVNLRALHEEFKVEVEGESEITRTPDAALSGKKSKRTSCHSSLGFHEFFSLEVWRASLGELLGTGSLVFMIDTIVISTFEMDIQATNLVLATLVALVAAIHLIATAPISGGHINPIVTFSAALVGLISYSRAFIYIVAQCVGAMLGALALRGVVSHTIADTYSLGGCTLTIVAPGLDGPVITGLETSRALCLEIACSFVFLYASIWMAFDGRQLKKMGLVLVCSFVGLVLGLLVFISTTVTATKGYSGAGLNPARCFGPAVVRGGHLWDGHWVFWVGPALSCAAFALYTKIIPQQHFKYVELHHA